MAESSQLLSLEKEENSPDRLEMESTADLGERRRSVRAKRDKPDYYDALDYDSKRQKTPRSDKKKVGLPTKAPAPSSLRRFPGTTQNLGRATLAWRKDEDESAKKKVKKTVQTGKTKEEAEEQGDPVLEDIPMEKVFSCAVGLAEINRKLGVVMWKPVQISEIK